MVHHPLPELGVLLMRPHDHDCGGPRWNDGFTGLYELAQKQGFRGTEREFLLWLRGPAGKSVYQLAVENGFDGTEEEYLASLKGDPFTYEDFTEDQLSGLVGPKGDDGKSAYEIAKDNGFEGTEEEFIDRMKGENGEPGKSAYEGAVESGLFSGTEAEFYYMLSLAGTYSFWMGTKDEFNSLAVDEMYAEKVIHFIIEGE